MLYIGKRRELFWDNYIIDTDKTTASLKLHSPIRRECVLVHDEPWKGDGSDYHNFFKDKNGIYRMYYLGWQTMNPDKTQHTIDDICICYAESTDGINWVKPRLGLCEFGGSKENNIILDRSTSKFDNFFVMRDSNPACSPDEIYKGIAEYNRGLWCFTSPDGIHFKKGWEITREGAFDSLNVALWDPDREIYIVYFRGYHPAQSPEDTPVRDIRYIVSKDFRHWSEPRLLDFGDGDDIPLYTNCISRYYRADHVFVGFPTRYIERKEWNDSFEKLCGKKERLERIKLSPRYGLALTDCVFMNSRDGFKWNRFDEAFIRPGPEEPHNWVYGDCYPALGMIETPGVYPGTDNEISMYLMAKHWMGIPAELHRYTIRLDGFVSRNATYKPQKVVTKPFVYEGSELRINFSTSAIGYIYIKLTAEDGSSIESDEIFGDKTDRLVGFKSGSPADLAGKPVVMEITMSDADIYSFKFD